MELVEDLRSSGLLRARAKTTSILDTRSSFCEREHCEDRAEVTALLRRGVGIACEDVAEEKLPGLAMETAVCEPLNFSGINAFGP